MWSIADCQSPDIRPVPPCPLHKRERPSASPNPLCAGKVEPLLTTTNEKGAVEGVKYDRVSVVLINAIKEQQSQIESLQKLTSRQQVQIESRDELIQKQAERLKRQEADLDALKKYICSETSRAELCRHKR